MRAPYSSLFHIHLASVCAPCFTFFFFAIIPRNPSRVASWLSVAAVRIGVCLLF
eukprot:NODE_2809_length_738_cov_44.776488_g1978_i0.p7 GENE.NODE_2809_length_738_cov_44.776488_g1978_i0~~NODE_2809_length_738_cov_44.776488_g1978_i0.p7  ORF type:complete len:54 (+),score=13.76 NODE_2809_length_738_cov_44.776488_g1978_i0:444-605(+)